jgi:hypothetical protein
LYCKLPIYPYKLARNNDIITNVQWNHCVVIDQISFTYNNIPIHSVIDEILVPSMGKEVGFDSLVKAFSKGKLRTYIERVIGSF